MRPAFVVTASLATATLAFGCQPRPDQKAETIKGDDAPKATASKTAASSAPVVEPPVEPPTAKATRKRKRTSDAGGTWKPAKTPTGAKLTLLNPKDGAGHQLFVSYDDTCYYEETPKGPPPPMPTGSRWVDFVHVDCPKEADDAAWDDCTGSTLFSVAGLSTCECHSMGGNPPPPPREVACPKK